MIENAFKWCIDCSNKQSLPHLPKGSFYCSFATHIFPNGVITGDIDASQCIKDGIYTEVEQPQMQ